MSDYKDKWCPFARVAPACNRDSAGRPIGKCIGPDCMAWRRAFVEFQSTSVGYCGLVSKPELLADP